jgi:chaperone required for assembly of F1-ATPase
MCRLDEFQLAGLERAVMTTKSLLLSVRLLMEYVAPESCPSRYGVEGIAQLASLEVRFQTQMWGEVEDSMSCRRGVKLKCST